MRRRILATLCIGFMSISLFAQNGNEAKSLLDEVTKKVESYDNISIEFLSKIDNTEADVHQETNGKVILQGEMYRLNYMGVEQMFNGDKIYHIIHEDEEVIIDNPSSDDESSSTPAQMLTFYKSGYTYQMDDLITIKGKRIQHVKLIPIDSNSEITSVMVGVDVKSKHIYSIATTDENSTVTTLEVRTFRYNQPLSEKLFIFDRAKYKDEKNYMISEPN
jgi:outer membrane lipoprotein-sorting protein